jgi:hypothetical protein
MWGRWWANLLTVLTVVAAVITVSAATGSYPLGLVILLVACLIAALWELQKRKDQGTRGHDSAIVSKVRKVINHGAEDWVRHHDFGENWRRSEVEPFRALERLNTVEYRPFDARLGTAARQLFEANSKFLRALGAHSSPDDGDLGVDWFNVGWNGTQAEALAGEEWAMYKERREHIGAAANEVVAAYDGFLDTAHRLKLLPTPS